MSDTHAGYIVTLKQDVHEEGSARIMAAIRLLQGVIDVQPITADFNLTIAEMRARDEWRGKVASLLWPPPNG